jgi:hypothetical protein
MSRKFKLPTQRTRGKTKRWSINPKLYDLKEEYDKGFLAGQNSQKKKDLEMIEKSEWIHPKCKKKVMEKIKNGK